MSYIIRADKKLTFSLGESDRAKSILQNCHLILSTIKGSVPMYRDFGIDMDFVDRPIPVAHTMLMARVIDTMATYEPRVEVINITVEQDISGSGRMIPILEVDIVE